MAGARRSGFTREDGFRREDFDFVVVRVLNTSGLRVRIFDFRYSWISCVTTGLVEPAGHKPPPLKSTRGAPNTRMPVLRGWANLQETA